MVSENNPSILRRLSCPCRVALGCLGCSKVTFRTEYDFGQLRPYAAGTLPRLFFKARERRPFAEQPSLTFLWRNLEIWTLIGLFVADTSAKSAAKTDFSWQTDFGYWVRLGYIGFLAFDMLLLINNWSMGYSERFERHDMPIQFLLAWVCFTLCSVSVFVDSSDFPRVMSVRGDWAMNGSEERKLV